MKLLARILQSQAEANVTLANLQMEDQKLAFLEV